MQPADARRDDARLVVLVLGLDHADRLARAELAPEALLDASRVVLDHRVGGVEDALRGAVVLLQAHDARVREVALEVEDVADVGAAPGVDGLVDVADDEDVAVRVGEQAHDAVLRVVRVLVLVDEQVVERALPALAHVVEALEQVDACAPAGRRSPSRWRRAGGARRARRRRPRPARRSCRCSRGTASAETRRFFSDEMREWMPRGGKRLGSRPSSSRHALTTRTWSAWS